MALKAEYYHANSINLLFHFEFLNISKQELLRIAMIHTYYIEIENVLFYHY